MKLKFIILFMFFSNFSYLVFAGEIEVKTGFGYFVDSNGHITDKATLPIGKHPLEGYTYVEVASKNELDAVKLYIKPKTDKLIKEEMIQIKIREQAIKELQKEGKLNAQGEINK